MAAPSVQLIALKRGSTWQLPVILRQVGADWTTAQYLLQVRLTPESEDTLAEIIPTAAEPVLDDNGRYSVTLTITLPAETTAEFPIGKVYAGLRVIRPEPHGTQYPCEWIIDNRVQIPRE